MEKYRGENHASTISSPLIPSVFEHFGHWGNEGQKFRRQLSARLRDDDGKANFADFKAYCMETSHVSNFAKMQQ